MLKVSVEGKLVDCVSNPSKDGKKDYYSLVVYDKGISNRIGVNKDLYEHYQNFIDERVEINNVTLWSQNYSLYVKA